MNSQKDKGQVITQGVDYIDEEYDTRMVAFEMDCNDGKGAPEACHHVGDYFAVVKVITYTF